MRKCNHLADTLERNVLCIHKKLVIKSLLSWVKKHIKDFLWRKHDISRFKKYALQIHSFPLCIDKHVQSNLIPGTRSNISHSATNIAVFKTNHVKWHGTYLMAFFVFQFVNGLKRRHWGWKNEESEQLLQNIHWKLAALCWCECERDNFNSYEVMNISLASSLSSVAQ